MNGQQLPPPGAPQRPQVSDSTAVLVLGFILAVIAAAILGGRRWVGIVLLAFAAVLVLSSLVSAVRRQR